MLAAGGHKKGCGRFGKQFCLLLKMLTSESPYDPEILLLGIQKRLKAGSQTDISTPMFIAALFTVAKMLKQPKCLSMNEWTYKLVYIHTMEYYSAIKRNEIIIYVTTWINLRHYAK